jgi:hypothetical protein
MRAASVMQRFTGLTTPAVVVLALAAPVGVAAAAGPFDGLEGVWTGNGTLTYASGTKEALSCRVQYLQPGPNSLTQALRCASDSYNFQINASFDSVNGQIKGKWRELVNSVAGDVTGTVSGGRINGQLQGPTFIAQLRVVTTGDRQTVVIDAPIEEIRTVSIEVRKAPR